MMGAQRQSKQEYVPRLQVFSHGRLVLGYGAGWAEEEYRAYGYDFPPAKVRIAQMVDGIKVMRALWSGGSGRRSPSARWLFGLECTSQPAGNWASALARSRVTAATHPQFVRAPLTRPTVQVVANGSNGSAAVVPLSR